MSEPTGVRPAEARPLTFPAVPVQDLLGILGFLRESYDELVAVAGARGYEPVLTIPPHLVEPRARLLDEIERQTRTASSNGEATVAISIEPSMETLRLFRWYIGRRRMFDTLPVSELPPAWGNALAVLHAFIDAMLVQVPQGWA